MSLDLVSHIESIDTVKKFNEIISAKTLSDLEGFPSEQLKQIIKDSSLANLLLPEELGGQGYDLKTTLHVLQYVGEKAPSMGLILCMHYHVVATISLMADQFPFSERLLSDVAKNNALLASAFAEGVPGRNIFISTVNVIEKGDEYWVSGTKKPCTMTNIADYFLVSVAGTDNQTGLALIDADKNGIERKEFWPSHLLRSADSHCVTFNNVKLAMSDVLLVSELEIEGILALGMTIFNLMINAAYTGVAVALAKKLPESIVSNKTTYIEIYGRLAQSYNSAYGIADRLQQNESTEHLLHQALVVRYINQMVLKNVASLVKENIGSFDFFNDKEVDYLSSVCNLIAFHPFRRNTYENFDL